MKKKMLSMLLALTVTASLVGCATTGGTETAAPAADAPDEPIPLHGLIPFLILISIPKSEPVLFNTSVAAIPTEFLVGSVGMPSLPGPEISVILIPESIFLPSIVSNGSSSANPNMSNPAPMFDVVAGA